MASKQGTTARLKTVGIYPLTVNYSLSVEDAVKLGQYHGTNRRINSKTFRSLRRGAADIVMEVTEMVVQLPEPVTCITTEEVLSEFYLRGSRPAELRELLAFHRKYPDIQIEADMVTVVALGSFYYSKKKQPYAPCLRWFSGGRRSLDLEIHRDEWCSLYLPPPIAELTVYCFAAVRK